MTSCTIELRGLTGKPLLTEAREINANLKEIETGLKNLRALQEEAELSQEGKLFANIVDSLNNHVSGFAPGTKTVFPLGSEEIVIRGLPVWIRPSEISESLIVTVLYENIGAPPHVFTVPVGRCHWKYDRNSAIAYLEEKITEHLRAPFHS